MHGIILAATGDPTVDWLSRASGVGVMALVVVGFMRGWIVPGAAHQRVLSERDRAMNLVYEIADVARRAIEAGERGAKGDVKS